MEAVILYAPGRGLAEPVRLTLHYVGQPWREESLQSPEHWAALKASGRLPFGQVPAYEIDGLSLSETPAVLRHLARTRNLYGRTDAEAMRADMLVERLIAFRSPIAFQPFAADPAAERDRIVTQHAPLSLGRIERWLQTVPPAPDGLLPQRSYADLYLCDALSWLLELDAQALDDLPTLRRLYEGIAEDAKIRDFYASDRHFGPPDEAYVAHVRWVFGMG